MDEEGASMTLSNYIFNQEGDFSDLSKCKIGAEDVKEFIRDLKMEIGFKRSRKEINCLNIIIDKLAGDKLI